MMNKATEEQAEKKSFFLDGVFLDRNLEKSVLHLKIKEHLRGTYGDIRLKNADEDICLLVLQALVELKESGELKQFGSYPYFEFRSCCIGYRFFTMLSTHFMDCRYLQVAFDGDCNVTFTQKEHFEEVAKCFDKHGHKFIGMVVKSVPVWVMKEPEMKDQFFLCLHVSTKTVPYGNREPHVPKSDNPIVPASSTKLSEELGLELSFPCVRVDEIDKVLKVTEAPLILVFSRAQILSFVRIECRSTIDFTNRTVDALCKRWKLGLTLADFQDRDLRDVSVMMKIFDIFNPSKSTYFKLSMDFTPEKADMVNLVRKALQVLCESIYLEDLEISVGSSRQMPLCRLFFQGLEAIVCRMRAFKIHFKFPSSNFLFFDDERNLMKLAKRIEAKRAWGQSKERSNLLIMASARVCMRLNSRGHLHILPNTVLRELYAFLMTDSMKIFVFSE